MTLALVVLVCSPIPTYGAELRQADVVVVPAGETIDDDLYAFGQTITIQGRVNGDVIAAGQSVYVGGTVAGSVMAAGNSVVIAGPVGGTVRLVGQTVELSGPVAHDALVGAATLNVGPQATIGRDLLMGGNTVIIGGPIGRSIRAGAETLTIGGPVGGDVLAHVGALHLTSRAAIEGSLSYTSSGDASLEPGSNVRGMTTRLEPVTATPEPSALARLGWGVADWLKALIGIAAFGLTLVWLFPGFSQRAATTLTRAPWASLGLGFALLVGMPVAAVLLFVVGLLVGGWWLGPLALALSVGLLPIGYVIGGLVVGHFLMTRGGRPSVALAWSMLAGLSLLGLVSLLPVVGVLSVLMVLMCGLGAFAFALMAAYRERSTRPPLTVTPAFVPSNGVHDEAQELVSTHTL